MRLRYFAVSLLWLAAVSAGAQGGRKAQAGKAPELRIDYTKETLPPGKEQFIQMEYGKYWNF